MIKEHFAKQLWISFGIVLGSIAAAAVALYLFSGKISAAADAIVTDRAMVQDNTDAVANLAQLEGQAPQAAQYEAALDQLLPDQYGLVSFPQWLAQVGAKYGVTTSASFQGSATPPSGATPGTVQFSFTAIGAPTSIVAFLHDMNARPSGFLLSLTSFTMTGAGGASEQMTGQGTLFFR